MCRDADKAVLESASPSIQGKRQPADVLQLLFNLLLVPVVLFFYLDKHRKDKNNTKNEF